MLRQRGALSDGHIKEPSHVIMVALNTVSLISCEGAESLTGEALSELVRQYHLNTAITQAHESFLIPRH